MAFATRVDATIDFHGVPFGLSARLGSDHAITVQIMSMDRTEQWAEDFGSQFIEDVTRKAGSAKKAAVFWTMLCTAALRKSRSVRLEVFRPSDLNLRGSDEKLFLVLTLCSEFDKVKYPLQLTRREFAPAELIDTIRELQRENARLRERLDEALTERSVESLGGRVSELSAMLEDVQRAKDGEIRRLRRRLSRLAAAAQRDERPGPTLRAARPYC